MNEGDGLFNGDIRIHKIKMKLTYANSALNLNVSLLIDLLKLKMLIKKILNIQYFK